MKNVNKTIWEDIVVLHEELTSACMKLFAEKDFVETIKKELRGKNPSTAMFLAEKLDENQLKEVFGELVFLCSWPNGQIGKARRLILSIDRKWVLSNIKNYVEDAISKGEDEAYSLYRCFIDLYDLLDKELARELAYRALESSDEDVKEAGRDYLV